MMTVAYKVTKQEEIQNYYDEMSAAFNISDRDMGYIQRYGFSVHHFCQWSLCVRFFRMPELENDSWRPMPHPLFKSFSQVLLFRDGMTFGRKYPGRQTSTQTGKCARRPLESTIKRLNPCRSHYVTTTAIKVNLLFLFQTALWLVMSKNTHGWRQERLMINRSATKIF